MKKLISAFLSAAFLSTFAGCTMVSDAERLGESIMDSAESMVSEMGGNSRATISEKEAREIALKSANFSEDEVTFLRSDLEKDGNTMKYEVEFTKDGVEYEFKIDAKDGTVLWVDEDAN